jgi:hypothetical protein
LALEVVRVADDCCLSDLGMGDQCALNLGGAETMARNVDNVVDTAGDPVVVVGLLIPIEGAHQNEMIAPAVTE